MRNVIQSLVVMGIMSSGCTSEHVSFELREAALVELPGAPWPGTDRFGATDCNNPVHWHDGLMYVFSSTGHPYRSCGPDLFHLAGPPARIAFDNERDWNMGGRWFEATWQDEDGTLYGWYHNEPPNVCDRRKPRDWSVTAPRIGAAVSRDNGLNWTDLGIVLEAPPDALVCNTPNGYFAGGNGDFCVIPDEKREFLYFLISTYHSSVVEQGISIARMPYAARDNPVRKAVKWYQGRWSEPGLGGHVTPIIPVTVDWHDPTPDAVWGPSVHWNTFLRRYVILFNRAVDARWKQGGVYITFNPRLDEPGGWSAPSLVLSDLNTDEWYPQIIGMAEGESDKQAGCSARLFIRGKSRWEISFRK